MQSAELRQQRDVLHQIAKASDAIRRKHKMLKMGRDTSEKAMSEVFKPVVTPLQQLVDQSMKQEMKQEAVKREIQETPTKQEFPRKKVPESDDYSFLTADEESSDENQPVTPLDSTIEKAVIVENDLPQTYLRMFETSQAKELDTSYGVRRLKGNVLKIGNSVVTFDNDIVRIGSKSYQTTPGLLELLFKKSPSEAAVNQSDLKNYSEIVANTNAHRKYYLSDTGVRYENNDKFKKIISKIPTPVKQKTGKALPRFKIAGGKKSRTDYVYWDDPNELVERLRLLYASQAAGNTSHSNEIISIIEELREAGIIY